MLQTVVETLYNAASGGRMMETIRSLGRYHRVQFSDGYRKAAEECRQILRGEDIQSELLSYDAHNERWYLTSKVFQEWDCRRAWCSLVFPVYITEHGLSYTNCGFTRLDGKTVKVKESKPPVD